MIAVRSRRGGYQEDEVRRSVRGAEVDPGGGATEGEGRLGDVRAAAVGDADAAVEAGRHLGLARGDVGEEALEVGGGQGV